jgi:S-DNA-T family DNA segregation ATPase FtsK/SpoIIIE
MDRCEPCGFVYADLPRAEVAGRLRAFGPAYATRLAAPPRALRAHTRPGVWSGLEYACHVRDVFRVQRERLARALAEDRPPYTSMDRDGRVTRDRYNEQAPADVARDLVAAADALADAFAALDDAGWARVMPYGWPTPAEQDVAWLGRHTVHEGLHHLADLDEALVVRRAGWPSS